MQLQKKNRKSAKVINQPTVKPPPPPLTFATIWPSKHGHCTMLTVDAAGTIKKARLLA